MVKLKICLLLTLTLISLANSFSENETKIPPLQRYQNAMKARIKYVVIEKNLKALFEFVDFRLYQENMEKMLEIQEKVLRIWSLENLLEKKEKTEKVFHFGSEHFYEDD